MVLGRNFRNLFRLKGRRQIWKYSGGCEYGCEFHKGKVEWHHPCSQHPEVGVFLCEAHHSILQGRQRRYFKSGEQLIDKKIDDMRKEIQSMVEQRVLVAGLKLSDIDKG